MKSLFEVRDYPNKLIEQEMGQVKFYEDSDMVRQRDP